MAVHTVVVVGSSESLPEHTQGCFRVIDFSNAPTGAPTVVSVLCSSNGVVVDCASSLAAVAAITGGSVTIYDISSPGAPQEKGSASLPFNNIGAISFNGDYVLVGQAQPSTGGGAQVALIDINNLASPKVYGTNFDTITDVTLFGPVAVICGLAGDYNAFQVAKTSDFHNLVSTVVTTSVSHWSEDGVPFMCDFDGTNAVFSDGHGFYVFKVSGGAPTFVGSPSTSANVTSVAIAESGGASSVPTGGVQLAYTGVNDADVELLYIVPPVHPEQTGPAAGPASATLTISTANRTPPMAASRDSTARFMARAPSSPPPALRRPPRARKSMSSRYSTSAPGPGRSQRRGKARESPSLLTRRGTKRRWASPSSTRSGRSMVAVSAANFPMVVAGVSMTPQRVSTPRPRARAAWRGRA